MVDVTDLMNGGSASPAPAVVSGTSLSGLIPVPQIDPLQQIQETKAATQAYTAKLSSLSGQAAAIGNGGAGVGVDAARRAGAAKALVSNIDEAAEIKRVADDQTAAIQLGLVPGAADSMTAKMGMRMQAEEEALLGLHDKIVEKQNLSFMDNPLQWITNQISTPYDIQEYNTRAEGINQMSSVTKELSTMFDDQHRVNMAVDSGASAERMAAKAQAIKADADVVASQLMMQGAHVGLANIQAQSMLAAGQLEGALKQTVAVNAIRSATEQANVNTLQTKIAEIALKRDAMNEQDRTAIESRLQLYGRVLNLPPEQTPTYADWIKMDMPSRVEFSKVLASVTANAGDGKEVQYESNPIDAATVVKQFGLPLGNGGNVMLDGLNKLISTTTNSVAQKNIASWGLLDNTAKKGLINQELMPQIKNMFDSSTGLYAPPTLAAIVRADPASANTEIGKIVTQLAASNPNARLTGDGLNQVVINAIEGGMPIQLAVKQATDLVHGTQVTMNATFGYKKLAMPTYTQDPESGNVISPFRMITTNQYGVSNTTHDTVDYANPIAYQAYIMRQMAGKRAIESNTLIYTDPTNPKKSIMNPIESGNVMLKGLQ